MNILVVEDHKLFRQSLVNFLKIAYQDATITEASSGQETLFLLQNDAPDIVLLDINLGGITGLEVAAKIIPKYPNLKVIVLTMVDGEAMIIHLYKVGVHGFLFKNIDISELKNCITTVLNGERYFCDAVNKIILKNPDKIENTPKVKLTNLEMDIIHFMKEGKTSKEISEILKIKEKTVTGYREMMLKKTQTKNATELVAYCMDNVILR